MAVVSFMDMSSGGSTKLVPFEHIYIILPSDLDSETEGKLLFERVFGRDPDHVTCSCCGEDYSVHAYNGESALMRATAYHRSARNWNDAERLEDYWEKGETITVLELARKNDVLFITSALIDEYMEQGGKLRQDETAQNLKALLTTKMEESSIFILPK